MSIYTHSDPMLKRALMSLEVRFQVSWVDANGDNTLAPVSAGKLGGKHNVSLLSIVCQILAYH